jgi:hypothetical protein
MKFFPRFLILFVVVVSPIISFAQNKATISGYLKDKDTYETLIGASVYFKETLVGTASNNFGFYSLTGDTGTYTLVISYAGYVTQEIPIHLTKNTPINIDLQYNTVEIKEHTVDDSRNNQNYESTKMGQIELKVEDIKKIPALLGEVDVLKTIQLLPGVKSSGEGNSGFYVRGGGPDQNLILLDNTVVYNASHLFGFFSIFNSDAIKNVTLIKGGMPANYGGRLSSVLDITMKEGNMKKIHGEGGIGIIASRFTLEGPIVKEKLSFLISARRTYADLFAPIFLPPAARGNGYYFYDVNAKMNWQIGKKDRLFLSGYFGQDVFHFKSANSDLQIDIPWGNAMAALRWNHQFGSKVFMNSTFSFTNYNFSTTANSSSFGISLSSGIRDFSLKSVVDWIPNPNHNIKFGADYTFHTFIPNSASARFGDSTQFNPQKQELYSHDFSLFILDEFNLGKRVRINLGGRFNYYQQFGPFDRYVKNDLDVITDTIHYGVLDKVADYARFEPRFNIRVKLTKTISLKAAYTLNYQNMHLANLATVSLPTDVWLPSTSKIKPQEAHQVNLGYYQNLFDNRIEISVEGYYKHMFNVVEYKDNTSFSQLVSDNPDNVLTVGQGRSFGVEFFVRGGVEFKIKGHTQKMSGWIGYTLAWTQRFGFNKNELHYDGDFYYPRYDRRHDLSVVFSWEIGKRWIVSAVYVYSTGNALAVPSSFYLVGNNLVPYYQDRDNYRMQPYHRLDLGATYILHKGKKWEHSLNMSIYNVYSRQNPFFVYFDLKSDAATNSVQFTGKQISLFPIVPSITWNFKF